MRRILRILTTLLLTTSLTACDDTDRKDGRLERDSRDYQAAMADYTAGRLDAAVKGFEKAIHNDPANANARFQLACLLQEFKNDPLGAFCGYREYLLQHPKSDKAQLARDRMLLCEREMAKILAEKHALLGNGQLIKDLDAARAEAKEAIGRNATLNREIEATRARVNSLIAERDRLLAFLKDEGSETKTASARPAVHEIKDLLEEDEVQSADASRTAEVAQLRNEEADERSSGSMALPERKAEDVARREGRKAGEDLARDNAVRSQSSRPDAYVVQEGDTLYKIAIRFYGRTSAWRQIRDANKTVISNDGRVKVGDRLRLP